MNRQNKLSVRRQVAMFLIVALLSGNLPTTAGTVSRAADNGIQTLRGAQEVPPAPVQEPNPNQGPLYPTSVRSVQEIPPEQGQNPQLKNPTTDSNGITTWDCIWFGNYWQESKSGEPNNTPPPAIYNGPVPDETADDSDYIKSPIKWWVLSVNGDDAFLLADTVLDRQQYNTVESAVTWETCTLRSWLNGYGADANAVGNDYSGVGFLDRAFTEAERQAIQVTDVVNNDNLKFKTLGGNNTSDKVYLLSIDEAKNPAYGFTASSSGNEQFAESRRTFALSYAKRWTAKDWYNWIQDQLLQKKAETVNWWLRSPGDAYGKSPGTISTNAAHVTYVGYVDGIGFYVAGFDHFVRPVLHLKLNAASDAGSVSNWSYAGTVSASGGPKPEPAATAKPAAKKIGTVAGLKATAKKRQAQVTWKKVTGVKGYQIYYSSSNKFKKKKQLFVKKNKVSLKKLKAGKTYFIKVRAYTANGNKKTYGKWSKVLKIKCKK